MECSRTHKRVDQCSGLGSDSTEYIPSQQLKEADTEEQMNVLVQRDYNFLIGMNRKLAVMKEDGKARNKKTLQQGSGSIQNRFHVSKPHRVLRRGVKCLILPKGMHRSMSNKSKWDKPLDTFVWSLEWSLFGDNGKVWNHVSHRNKEDAILVDCVGKQVYDKLRETYSINVEEDETKSTKEDRSKQLIEFGLKFFTKWFQPDSDSIMDTKTVIEINPTKCLGEIFKDMTVIEFPTIFIVPDSEVMTKHGYLLHSDIRKAEKTAETDGKEKISEDTSSSSDSEETDRPESSDQSDSSSEPEEESAKVNSDSEDGYSLGVSLDFLTS